MVNKLMRQNIPAAVEEPAQEYELVRIVYSGTTIEAIGLYTLSEGVKAWVPLYFADRLVSEDKAVIIEYPPALVSQCQKALRSGEQVERVFGFACKRCEDDGKVRLFKDQLSLNAHGSSHKERPKKEKKVPEPKKAPSGLGRYLPVGMTEEKLRERKKRMEKILAKTGEKLTLCDILVGRGSDYKA